MISVLLSHRSPAHILGKFLADHVFNITCKTEILGQDRLDFT